MRVMQALSIVQKDVQELDSVKKITFLIGFALVNEIGGNLFQNFEFDFSLVFWVRSREKHKKHVIFSLRSKIIHTFYVFHLI